MAQNPGTVEATGEIATESKQDEIIALLDPPKEYFLEVARGNVSGVSSFTFVANNPSLGLTFEDLWDAGGTMTYPTAAETWEIVSNSDEDTSGGVGARTVRMISLDGSYNEQTTNATLNGTTPVVMANTHFRPRIVAVTSSGDNQENTGTITVRVSGGGDTRLQIQPTEAVSFSSHYTVPAGKTAYFLQSSLFVPKNEDVVTKSKIQFFGTNTFVGGGSVSLYQNTVIVPVKSPTTLSEKTDLKFMSKSTNTGVNVSNVTEVIVFDDTVAARNIIGY